MKFWHISILLLAVLIAFLAFYSLLLKKDLTEIIEIAEAESFDVLKLREKWDDASFRLNLSVHDAELDLIEADLILLERLDDTDSHKNAAKERLKNRLRRLYDGCSPSFSGLF